MEGDLMLQFQTPDANMFMRSTSRLLGGHTLVRQSGRFKSLQNLADLVICDTLDLLPVIGP